MMIYVIPKDDDKPIKIVFEGGKGSGSIVEDDQVYLIDEHPSPEEVGKAFRMLYERLMSIEEEALEKQIPKKPINEGCYYLCPCCRGDLGVSDDDIFIYELSMPKYCSNCGCVLDWTEVDYWLRQGYSLEDTNELIKTSTVLSKIGLIDSAEATQYLTSAISGLAEGMSNAAKLGTSCNVEVDGGD
jgi:hypothetical protein